MLRHIGQGRVEGTWVEGKPYRTGRGVGCDQLSFMTMISGGGEV